ncbi:hypothetical protein JW710_02905 [Candidatus Dojkabacteria bacterium]|nr:hypothetical protein [Candidatus Dojkabacteria bacterium]
MRIFKSIIINTPAKNLVLLFFQLEKTPGQYSMPSHKGFTVIEGKLDKPGSIIETQEKFLFFFVKAEFIIRDIDETGLFTLYLQKPLGFLDVLVKFRSKRIDTQQTLLSMDIYQPHNTKTLKRIFFNIVFTLISPLIRNQIGKELILIKNLAESQARPS